MDFARWMEEGSSGGASPCKGFHEGDPGGRTPLLGNPKDGVFERLARVPVDGPLCMGALEGVHLPGLLGD
jgi:hypothetical protein